MTTFHTNYKDKSQKRVLMKTFYPDAQFKVVHTRQEFHPLIDFIWKSITRFSMFESF
jgi:hypothetical protein